MSEAESRVVTGKGARLAAALFNYGNIAAVLIPIPVGLLWLAASIVIYAMNRHHPEPRVGHYTQQAAYRFYGTVGFFVVAANFIPAQVGYFLAVWALGILVIVPWSLVDLVRIHRETWPDLTVTDPAGVGRGERR